jgi:hypothetical protein
MDEENKTVVVASFPKNAREAICVGTSEYKGKQLIFVRAYVPSLSGELIPTPKGISLAVEKCGELVAGVRALEAAGSTEKEVARIQKNSKEEIRVEISIFKEMPLIQIRTYALFGENTGFKATQKGVAMNVNLLPQLLEAMQKLSVAV